MIKGIGVDSLEIERIDKVIERHGARFIKRILTVREQAELSKRPDPVNYLAKQFAVKEAIAKCFGTGIGRLSFLDIEVLRTSLGQPVACILNSAQPTFLAGKLHVSISDTKTTVTAFAVLELSDN